MNRPECKNKCCGQKNCVVCHGIKNDGGLCRNRTCRTNLCWQHLKRDQGLRVKQDKVYGHGLGLFATKEFKPDDLIANYTGEYTTKAHEECPGDTVMQYGIQIKKDLWLNSTNSTDAAGRFANDPRGTGRKPNAKLVVNQKDKTVKLRALKTIKPTPANKEPEVLVNYGKDYWAGEKCDHKEKEKELPEGPGLSDFEIPGLFDEPERPEQPQEEEHDVQLPPAPATPPPKKEYKIPPVEKPVLRENPPPKVPFTPTDTGLPDKTMTEWIKSLGKKRQLAASRSNAQILLYLEQKVPKHLRPSFLRQQARILKLLRNG